MPNQGTATVAGTGTTQPLSAVKYMRGVNSVLHGMLSLVGTSLSQGLGSAMLH